VLLNSVARQVVFTEGGRGVETLIVGRTGRHCRRKITTIDERALREEIAGLMKFLRKDIEAVVKRNNAMLPYLLEAQRRTWQVDIGLNRLCRQRRRLSISGADKSRVNHVVSDRGIGRPLDNQSGPRHDFLLARRGGCRASARIR